MNQRLIQIVPRRGNAPEGVGDYARLIAERAWRDAAVRTDFVACTPLPPAERSHDEWATHELPVRSARALTDALAAVGGDVPVLLHLSAYGYNNKGVPFWLVAAIRAWRRANPATPLVTVFHELYATGPIWGSAFWLGTLQAGIARRIQRVSTAGIATTEPYAALLERWRGSLPVSTRALPVFSTIGHIAAPTPVTERPATLAIFGRAGIFKKVYEDRVEDIAAFAAAQGITEIIDIGARLETPPAAIGGARVRSLGQLPATQLQEELGRTRFGLIEYDADRLAKSTVFAAYCAHGAIPVCLSAAPGDKDGLVPSENYVRLDPGARIRRLPDATLESLQRGAERWYQPHSLKSSTKLVLDLLGIVPEHAERV